MKPSNQALPQLNQIPYPAGSSDARKLKDKLAYAGLGPADEFMAQVSLLAEEKYQVYDPGSKKEPKIIFPIASISCVPFT